MKKQKLPELKRLSPVELQEVLSRVDAFKHTSEDARLVRQMAETLEFIEEILRQKDVRI